MVKYKKTSVTAKKGINFIRTVVEDSGCLFHKIEQENDLGIDALIELIKNEKPINKNVAVQIKSGPSYYNSKSKECIIPIDTHREYWKEYPLPVYGIVYVPELKKGYWVNIKSYLKNHPDTNTIRFIASRANQLDHENFINIFIPNLTSSVPEISFSDALSFFESDISNEFILGAIVLFRKYVNEKQTWDKLVNYILENEPEEIPYIFIHYLAHIPWHPDIFYTGENICDEINNYVMEKIKELDKIQVIKLLSFIDEEESIGRGTIGQSVEAIISKILKKQSILENIIQDQNLKTIIRNQAAIIYAYYYRQKGLTFFKSVPNDSLWIITELINQIETFGGINLYN